LRELFHPLGVNARGGTREPLRLAQERRFSGVGFHQVNAYPRLGSKRAGDDESGKAASTADIDPGARAWCKIDKLQGIGKVAGPHVRYGGWRNEVDGTLPFEKKGHEPIEPLKGFT